MAEVCEKKVSPLVSAAELVAQLPEYFENRFDVLRMAKARVIPCYVLPGTSRAKRSDFRFRVKDVRKAMESYFQPVR